ncbi:Alcohol dehydrogenase-like 6 [Morus notabilis]|uniref:Alcohol dehydrogenase-like 6 n=1 Tax=Morus notabilis TaxID=981085 RepID=W9QL58_9ROSA|nr:Alcohol dehydrogenase-like 6 [Morus notabilis]
MAPRRRPANQPAQPNQGFLDAMYAAFQGMATKAQNERPVEHRKQGYFQEFRRVPIHSFNTKAFGITDFINPNECNECIQQVVKHITDGGADYSFECIGDTGMITTALESCCDGWGLTVTLGVPKVNPVVTAHYGLLLTGRTLKGSLFGGWRPKSDLPSLVDMYMKKQIHIDDYITHNLPLEDINEAFNLMSEGKCLRCVIHMPMQLPLASTT